MIRRITEHQAKNSDHELLQVVTVWEEGIRKRDIKTKYSLHHAFLTKRGQKYKLIEK